MVVTLYKEHDKNMKDDEYDGSYKTAVNFFSRFEQMFGSAD